MKTTAKDKADGDKVIAAKGGTVVDRVDYQGLTPGAEYTIAGDLMDKVTGKSVAKSLLTFTPEAADGSVELEFNVDESDAAKTLVVFERAFEGKVTIDKDNNTFVDEDGKTVVDENGEFVEGGKTPVADHTDINDQAQTVTQDEDVPGNGGSSKDWGWLIAVPIIGGLIGGLTGSSTGGSTTDGSSNGSSVPGAGSSDSGEQTPSDFGGKDAPKGESGKNAPEGDVHNGDNVDKQNNIYVDGADNGAGESGAAPAGGALANTGASVIGLAGLALLLMIAGAVLAIRRRNA